MQTITPVFQTGTAAEIYAAYCDHLVADGKAKDIEHIKTALLRFTVPGWSNRYPAGRKSTNAEVAKSLDYLKRISAEQLKDASTVQETVFDRMQLTKKQRRQPRCFLNHMLEWAASKGYFGTIAPAVTEPEVVAVSHAPTRLRRPNGEARPKTQTVKVRSTKAIAKGRYALGTKHGDYVNMTLQGQITEFEDFHRAAGMREPTIKKTVVAVKGILGWLHRYRGVALEDLRLESIVPFTPLKLDDDDYKYKKGQKKGSLNRTAFTAAKLDLEDEAKKDAGKAIKLIESYFKWAERHPKSDVLLLGALINVAKYLYQDDTEKIFAPNYRDVPIILHLRYARLEKAVIAEQTPPTVSHAAKSIPWSDVHPVVLKVQAEADLRFSPCTGEPIADRDIAKNIQRLLILLLFVSGPPDRSRTIYELEVDRTLVLGQDKDGEFVPAARMQPGDQATWTLHLQPADSKTGDTYGETWDRLDDTPIGYLADGKTLYYYLNLWLKQYRDVFKPTHKCLLTADVDAPLNADKLWKRVRDMFIEHTGIPVTPKELRTMYVTYIKNAKVAAPVLAGAAKRMRHSLETQEKIYNQQSHDDKVDPALAFHQQMMQKASQPQKA